MNMETNLKKGIILLSEIKELWPDDGGGSHYINLIDVPRDKEENRLLMLGTHIGGRLVFKNADNLTIILSEESVISSTHKDHAIIFDGANNLSIKGRDTCVISGGIGFWKSINGLLVDNITFVGGKYGIHCTVEEKHTWIRIVNCTFQDQEKEGIYWGKHEQVSLNTFNMIVSGNEFDRVGWDGCQLGNVTNFRIYNNVFNRCGNLCRPEQDYGITINPNSRGYIWNNDFIDCPKEIQTVNATVFFHQG